MAASAIRPRSGVSVSHVAPCQARPPSRQRSSAARYTPAETPLVSVYKLTRQSHGTVCDTSYERIAAADEFGPWRPSGSIGWGWPEPISCGPAGCSLHM